VTFYCLGVALEFYCNPAIRCNTVIIVSAAIPVEIYIHSQGRADMWSGLPEDKSDDMTRISRPKSDSSTTFCGLILNAEFRLQKLIPGRLFAAFIK
jgi:hypothetical protein